MRKTFSLIWEANKGLFRRMREYLKFHQIVVIILTKAVHSKTHLIKDRGQKILFCKQYREITTGIKLIKV